MHHCVLHIIILWNKSNSDGYQTSQDGYSINNAPCAIDTYGSLFYNQPNISTTNQITYRLQMRSVGGNGTIYINRRPIRQLWR